MPLETLRVRRRVPHSAQTSIFFRWLFSESRDRLRHTLSSHLLIVQCSFILIGWFENSTKENNFLRSPFHCDDVFFALLPQEKAFPPSLLMSIGTGGQRIKDSGSAIYHWAYDFVIVKTSPYRNPYGIFIELARERRRKRNMSEDFSLFMYKVKCYDTYKSIASILQVVFISCYIGVTYPRFLRRI